MAWIVKRNPGAREFSDHVLLRRRWLVLTLAISGSLMSVAVFFSPWAIQQAVLMVVLALYSDGRQILGRHLLVAVAASLLIVSVWAASLASRAGVIPDVLRVAHQPPNKKGAVLNEVVLNGFHTGEEVLVAAEGPGAESFRGVFPNTLIFQNMMKAYGWSPKHQ